MNECLWMFGLIFASLGILAFYKLFGKAGLFVWLAISIIMANILAVKLVSLFTLETTMGSIMFSMTFIVINILNEIYGKKEAYKGIMIGLGSIIVMMVVIGFWILFEPSANDWSDGNLIALFSLNSRITFASLIAFIISQLFNVWIYQGLKRKYNKIWISNNVSVIISQLFDTIIFLIVAFAGTYSFNMILNLFIARYILKIAIAILDTPIIYIVSKIKVNNNI